ncbi:MAG: phasin family protein [Pseudomonadota bacterium]
MPPKHVGTTPQQADITGDVAAMQDQAMKSMSQMGLAWVEGMSDLGSEVLSFVADRIKQDVKTQHKMLHCKSVNELQHIQAEFIQTAIEDYTAETGKLVQMSHDIYTPPTPEQTDKD